MRRRNVNDPNRPFVKNLSRSAVTHARESRIDLTLLGENKSASMATSERRYSPPNCSASIVDQWDELLQLPRHRSSEMNAGAL
jgi:hypothetical protein